MSSLEMPHIRPPPQQQQRDSVITTGTEGKSRKSYSIEFKTQVINFYHAHAGNISLAAKMFGVDRKLVRSWVEQEDFFRGNLKTEPKAAAVPVITQSPAKPNSVSVVVTAPPASVRDTRTISPKMLPPATGVKYPELEKALSEWWMAQHSRGELRAKDVKAQALLLFSRLYPSAPEAEFKASPGWLQRFTSKMESLIFERAKMQASLPMMPAVRRPDYADEQRALRSIDKTTVVTRAAPYTVPEKLKPLLPAPAPSVIVQRSTVETPVTMVVDSGATAGADYTYMSPQDREMVERMNQESNRFFDDIRDWLAYIESVTERLAAGLD